jgi:hypothetical protein
VIRVVRLQISLLLLVLLVRIVDSGWIFDSPVCWIGFGFGLDRVRVRVRVRAANEIATLISHVSCMHARPPVPDPFCQSHLRAPCA